MLGLSLLPQWAMHSMSGPNSISEWHLLALLTGAWAVMYILMG
jgi:hypothetical protein